MQEESATLPILSDSSVSFVATSGNRKISTSYVVGKRVPQTLSPLYNKLNGTNVVHEQNSSLRVLYSSKSLGDVDMPSKKEAIIVECSQSPDKMKPVHDGGNEPMKTKTKSELLSEAAILRSVLRPQGVPVPVDKVGTVREPQVIVRKFNIPMLCPNNSAKFTKLKERWKYQHDVVGMTNVNPTNPLHAIMKSKPVVSYSVTSFVNDGASPIKSSNIITSFAGAKLINNTILPKNHLTSNWISTTSSITAPIPSSLPSSPTAVVKPVQVPPSQLSAATSIDGGKIVVLKAVNGSEINSDIESESELISSITSPTKIDKSQTIFIQDGEKGNEPQNGKMYLNPFAEVNKATETVEEVVMDQPVSLEELNVDSNTLHLEILSEGSIRKFKCAVTDTRDVEMSDISSASVPLVQEENVPKIPVPKVTESDAKGQARTFSFPRDDKPVTLITMPASVNGSVSQVVLKPQQSGCNYVPITSTPRLVANSVQQSDGSLMTKTIQLTPVAFTGPINGLQQKPIMNDIPLATSTKLTQQQMNELLKSLQSQTVPLQPQTISLQPQTISLQPQTISLQPQTISLAPTKLSAPVIVTSKSDAILAPKVKNDVVVLKPVQLQNFGDPMKNSNMNLLTTRQSIAMQYQRDMIKAQEEIRVPRSVSQLARNIEVVDTSTQTSLFSLLEAGRLVEMTLSPDSKDGKGGGIVMPSPTVRLTNVNSASRPSTSATSSPCGKRLVSVDSSGRVMTLGGSSSPTEPLTKRIKMDPNDVSSGNIFKLLCSANQGKQADNEQLNINKQTKNINEFMVCDNVIQQHNIAIDLDTMECRRSSNISKLELDGIEAMVVDPHDILPNALNPKKPTVPNDIKQISKKKLVQTAFKDWQNCLVPDEDGNIPLHNGILEDDLNQVKRQCFVLAARKESVDIRNAEKLTPLHLAMCVGNPGVVQTLMEFGARPDIVNAEGNNALHLSAERLDSPDCLQIVLDRYNCQPFINSMNYDGYSALHLTALYARAEQAVLLVKKEADINLRDGKSGRTALFHSVEARDSKMSRLLVQYGASASVTNFSGQTPLLATNDMSMLGERAMESVIMSRNSLIRSKEKAVHSSAYNISWSTSENEDR